MADSLKSIKSRQYINFRGVDFTGGNVPYYRSPDALNMWKDYKDDDCVQTRPGMILKDDFGEEIFGLFFLEINNVVHCLVHAGTKLIEWNNYPNVPASKTEKFSGMNVRQSTSFIFDETLFIIDGINYLEYDGSTVKKVEGTIPYTSYYRNPDGSSNLDTTTDTDTIYQRINLLSDKRINRFIGDGVSKTYYLDETSPEQLISVVVDETSITGCTMTGNVVNFVNAPANGAIVVITYKKTISGNAQKILNCTIACEFDNRFFLSGNPDYPNMVFHCELNDPRYFNDELQNTCGIDDANIKALVPGNNVLWVIKEIEQNNSSIHYLTPTYDSSYEKVYSDTTGSISIGCVSTGVNFNDDVVFFSNKGLEGIKTSSMYSEQILEHRSSVVDSKMLSENGYNNIKLAEYEGYLMCLIGSHVYLADSRQRLVTGANTTEYEWFYWELPNNITFIREYRGTLYLGNRNGEIFTLGGTNDNGSDINCYWTTKKDDIDYPAYTKTTNKRGNVANLKTMGNEEIEVSTIVDGTEKEKGIYNDSKGYIVYRIKDKKFKEIQFKFSSNKPFGLFSCTLQCFIAGYIKR